MLDGLRFVNPRSSYSIKYLLCDPSWVSNALEQVERLISHTRAKKVPHNFAWNLLYNKVLHTFAWNPLYIHTVKKEIKPLSYNVATQTFPQCFLFLCLAKA